MQGIFSSVGIVWVQLWEWDSTGVAAQSFVIGQIFVAALATQQINVDRGTVLQLQRFDFPSQAFDGTCRHPVPFPGAHATGTV